MRKLRALIVIPASLALVLGVAGCSTTEMPMSAIAPLTNEMGMDAGTAGSDTAMTMTKSDTGAPLERSTIENAWLSLTVTAPQAAADQATQIGTSAGGFVQDSSWSPASEYGPETAYLTLRVPADALNDVVSALEELGRVDSLSRNSSDVTLAVTDVNARIASLESSLESLRALQSQATNVSDLLAAESAIAQRQSELDSLRAQQTYLLDQVDLSTVGLTLTGQTGGAPTNDTFWDGLVAGWNSLGVVGAGLLVALGFALPWIILLAIVGGLITLVVVALVRRARASKVRAANKPAATRATPSKKR